MVKCRAFIRKYMNSELTNDKENSSIILCNRKRPVDKEFMTSTMASSHRPKWRRVCDDWVDRRLEGRQGVTTPVHVLYNTYLNENPMHYMDIAQFGKVLKSRFKNQKCRRGGQGAQIYVYKNVAIKSLDETKGDVSLSGPRLAPSSDVTASHPRPATTSDAFPPLPCSATLTDVTLSPSRSATPTDVRGPSPTQPTKRKASPESSIIPKKRKFIFENSLPQVTPPDSPSAEFFVSRSEHSASPAAPSVASQQEPGERAACGKPPQFLANSQAPKYNLRPASKAASVAPEETILWDEEQRENGQESPVEAQGISCRMAVGRKWVDAQLRDEPGARTFAWEVAAAYARDHPDEPLPDTSIAVLIRNKFPSRRKVIKQGPVTTYYFQDLELVNRKGLCEVPSVKEHNGPLNNVEGRATLSVNSLVSGAEASTLVNISEDGKPISVVNPPAQTVFIRNGVPCVVLKVKPFIVRPSIPQGKIRHEGSLDKQKDSISYEVPYSAKTKRNLIRVSQANKSQNSSNYFNFQLTNSVNLEDRGTIQMPFLLPGNKASPRLTRFEVKGKSPSSPDYPQASKRGHKSDMSVLEYIQSEITNKNDNEVFPTPTTTDFHNTTGRVNQKSNDNVQINPKLYQPEKMPKIKSKLINDYSVRYLAHKSKVWDKEMRKFACLNNQDAKIIKSNKSKLTEHRKGSLNKDKQGKISVPNENNNSKSRKNVIYEETEYRFGRMECIKRTILETALNLFSKEGASLPEGERARRLEAALYERNPAVQYKDRVPWPSSHSEDAEEFPCRASQVLSEASALAQGDATQLLYHHQYCPGQGCSYNGDLCLSLRAAYTHISIFRHRCHVWHCFSSVLALHASSCSRVDCPVQFCLFTKHELNSRGLLSWSAVEAERQLLRREFEECERSGRHEARLHCHHRQRVQLPLPKPMDKT
ncbi:uncharacterized protein LOC125040687 [Penaeus chinensis]|uniref:uncharacterized protein LOC125040687 n=1 Tax=Penaeus chinensis TaxID=139456 RepID=UPI001FB806A9|nr:uncharacterized protein LOC125040687 [Penaeus chinensis]